MTRNDTKALVAGVLLIVCIITALGRIIFYWDWFPLVGMVLVFLAAAALSSGVDDKRVSERIMEWDGRKFILSELRDE